MPPIDIYTPIHKGMRNLRLDRTWSIRPASAASRLSRPRRGAAPPGEVLAADTPNGFVSLDARVGRCWERRRLPALRLAGLAGHAARRRLPGRFRQPTPQMGSFR